MLLDIEAYKIASASFKPKTSIVGPKHRKDSLPEEAGHRPHVVSDVASLDALLDKLDIVFRRYVRDATLTVSTPDVSDRWATLAHGWHKLTAPEKNG
jgi:hypothetical protein